jgi:hypothetical protein
MTMERASGPAHVGRAAPLGRLAHPLHAVLPAGAQRRIELFRQIRPRIGARDAEGIEAEGFRTGTKF